MEGVCSNAYPYSDPACIAKCRAWKDNGTLRLLEWAIEDDHGDQVMLGMDAARQGYYTAFGGSPGLPYLVREFSAAIEERGIDAVHRRRFFIDNPARAFAFGEVE